MKKFLTVLLALSVVFTYTVGTAFAVTPDEATSAAGKAKTEASTLAETALKTLAYADGSLKYIGTTQYNGIAVSKTAVDQAAADLQTEINTAIQRAAEACISDSAKNLDTEIAEVKDAYYKDVATYLGVLFENTNERVYAKQAAINKTEALAKLNAVATSNYYDDDKAVVEAAVKAAVKAIEPLTCVAADLATINKTMSDYENAVDGYKTIAEIEKALADAKTDAIKTLKSKADTFKGDSTKGEIKRLSDIVADSKSTPAEIADAKAKLNMLDANVAAIVNLRTAEINAVTVKKTSELDTAVKTTIPGKIGTDFDSDKAFYETVAKLGGVSYLKEYAANKAVTFKAELAEDGTIKYYTTTVDEALAAVNAQIEALAVTTAHDVDDAFSTALSGKTKAEIDTALASLKDTKKAEIDSAIAGRSFSGERKDKVDSIVKDAKAAIDAAADADAIAKIVDDAKTKLAAILDDSQIAKLKNKVDKKYELTYKALIEGYVDSLITKNGADKYDAVSQKAGINTKVKEYYYDLVLAKEDKDLTGDAVAEIMAQNYAGAVAVAEKNLVAKSTLEDAEKALNAQIDALDYTVTEANTPQILAAYDALQNYKALNGSEVSKINTGKLNYLVAKVVEAEAKVINDKITAITIKPVFTMDDVAALEALKQDAEAYNAKYEGYPGFVEIQDPTTSQTANAKIEAARYQDAIDKINAIPEELTYADKAAVEAARAAYDALTDNQKRTLAASFITKLVSAETKMEILEVKAVESLKIKASSSAKKGSITVKWTVTGDASAADGYQVYKSTKANSGYKFMGKTQKTSMVNKKNLKKGTRYFYKVRAYKDIDGVRYYSDWSNKANRYAK